MCVIMLTIVSGLFLHPAFVVAKETCYVDADADDDGDGSKDDPYTKISKALSKDCTKIIVDKGTYKDDITLGDSVTIEGESGVTITGSVTMKDDTTLKEVTVSGGGISVDDDADVDIDDVKITGAGIGIETTGRGKLTVKDSYITGNGKGLYIQAGKDIKITDSDVSDNDEEGIDIRANVDGTISDNDIYSNGESGIEVILGKSELYISNNSIKKNSASGIAAQYYTESSSLGAVKITGNTITDNKDFGINCKAPSGGNPGADYWSASTNMTSNKVSDNKDGDFSPSCSFSVDEVTSATMTKQKKAELAQIAEEKRLNAAEEQERLAQEKLRDTLQKEKDLQAIVIVRFEEEEELYKSNILTQETVNKRSAFMRFIIGSNQDALDMLTSSLDVYEQKIAEAQSAQQEMTDEQALKDVTAQIETMQKHKADIETFVQNKREEFSIFYWLFKKEK